MKQALCIISLFLFFGCTTKVSEEDIAKLNGYWEIEKVTFANGATKDYGVNQTVDYIKLDGFKGFRKKMQPKFDGSFSTSNDAEPFLIQNNAGHFEFQYKNEMSAWEEEIQSISKDRFSVTNQDGLTYTYRRYQTMNLKE